MSRAKSLAVTIVPAVLAIGLTVGIAVGVTGRGARPASPTARPSTTVTPRTNDGATAPSTTASLPTTTTLDLSALPDCWPDGSFWQAPQPAPPNLAAALDAFAASPLVTPHRASVSVWIDGLGEVLARDPDLALAPASNQKLLTAMGALAVLGPDARLVTELRLTPSGDLVIEPGGDATLTATGPHSLAALAAQVRESGVTIVAGALLVDETRYDGARRAPGWQDWQIPTYTGPLSAFMVDRNRWRRDAAFLADPALANTDRLRAALALQGVAVAGPTGYAPAPAFGATVARVESATVAELVHATLQRSDNQIADEMLLEVGVATTGQGSTAAGGVATHAALEPLCLELTGITDDGSGLSRANARTARELRMILQGARAEPWWPVLFEGLPVAGRSGTLGGRLRGTAAEGNVRAKTGTIIGGAALSGYGTTAGGRAFVFSVIVNGPGTEAAAPAIDALVAAIAADTT